MHPGMSVYNLPTLLRLRDACGPAIGANYDRDAEAFIHLDCIVKSPTITLISRAGRRRPLMRAGRMT